MGFFQILVYKQDQVGL